MKALRAIVVGLLTVAFGVVDPATVSAGGRGEGPVRPVRIHLLDRDSDLRLLTELDIDLDGVFDGWARAYVLEEEAEKLAGLGFALEPLPDEGAIGLARVVEEGVATPGQRIPTAYHTYETLTAELQQIAADHPGLVRLSSIGTSVQGRELWTVKVTADPDVEEDEPEFRYIAAMHGDEVVGKELCVELLHLLTDGYGSDPRITEIVDTTEIWVLPSMNPDGTALGRRYNAQFVDLNRNFPDQYTDPVDSPAGRAPETQNVMNWGYAHSPVLSANFHGGTLVANYPFDSTPSGSSTYAISPDDALFVSIARTYADDNPPMSASNSDASFHDGICNGSDWYAIRGGLQDWSYVWHGDLDLTLEISTVKWPPASQLPGFWNDNRESMLAYLERAREGIRGIVTDAATGAPLAATVRIAGNGIASYTDPDVGDFHRPLLPGRYALEIGATGYASAIVEDVFVGEGPATRVDAALTPLAARLHPVSDRIVAGDGALLPGGAADLAVTLRNLGSEATAVAGRLVAAGWYGEVTRADASYADLPPGADAESAAPHYGIAADVAAPAGGNAMFAIEWASAQGSGTTDAFAVPVGEASCFRVDSADTPLPVLDRATTASAVVFSEDIAVGDLRVRVDVTHTYRGDLRVRVVSPSGAAVQLHGRSGGSADDLLGWYPDDLGPAEPLSRLAGEGALGTWSLEVVDDVPLNGGILNAWSLEVCGRPPDTTVPEVRLRDVTRSAGSTTLTWWPYPGVTGFRVYRGSDPSEASSFVDVTSEDPDPTDFRFEDASGAPLVFWLVTGTGPSGEGPKGHFGE